MKHDLESIASNFQLAGQITKVEPFGSGHINDTYAITCQAADAETQYVLQRINHEIFKNPVAMMDNIERVTEHIRRKLLQQNSPLLDRQLIVIATDRGTACFEDGQGNFWRVYNRIGRAITYDRIESPELAFEAARMFGWFQRMLADLPGAPLHETIIDFHTTPKRLNAFEQVLKSDPCGRAKDVAPEVDFVQTNADICGVLLDLVGKGEIPVRTTHNDTKINNVMLDSETHKGVCVIDLDTVMPGLSLYDFGDMVRTATHNAAEDEQDLSKVEMDMAMLEQLVRGFASQTHTFLTPAEKKHLAFAGKLITFEQMIRFLGDHLAGDVYYKIHRPSQNLDRARTQMKLVQSIVRQQDEMNELADSVFDSLYESEGEA